MFLRVIQGKKRHLFVHFIMFVLFFIIFLHVLVLCVLCCWNTPSCVLNTFITIKNWCTKAEKRSEFNYQPGHIFQVILMISRHMLSPLLSPLPWCEYECPPADLQKQTARCILDQPQGEVTEQEDKGDILNTANAAILWANAAGNSIKPRPVLAGAKKTSQWHEWNVASSAARSRARSLGPAVFFTALSLRGRQPGWMSHRVSANSWEMKAASVPEKPGTSKASVVVPPEKVT